MKLLNKIIFKLLEKMTTNDMNDLYFKKLKYGLEILFINFSKIIFFIFIALILGILKSSLIIILSFAFIRFYAFGFHAKTNLGCLLLTTIIFIIGSFIPEILTITNSIISIMFILSIILLYLYSPADSEARPLIGKELRKILKFKSIKAEIILLIISLLIKSHNIKFFIAYGILVESISTTPILYKVFNRRYRNYENVF